MCWPTASRQGWEHCCAGFLLTVLSAVSWCQQLWTEQELGCGQQGRLVDCVTPAHMDHAVAM